MSNPLCRVCGRELDDCGTCACVGTPYGDVLRYILGDCVGPAEPPEQDDAE